MQIRMPIRDGLVLIINDGGVALEVTQGTISTWPLDDDAMLTLRDGCDAAHKIKQAKARRTKKAGRCRQGTKIKSPTGGVWTRSDNVELMSNPPQTWWHDETGAQHLLRSNEDVEVLP